MEAIQSVAKSGLNKPVTWIRHLDAAVPKQPNQSQVQRTLADARQFLTGSDKKLDPAEKLLLTLSNEHASELTVGELCYVYTYLGYIEDLRENRSKASEWFQRAVKLKGETIDGIQSLAEEGLCNPVTYIRHLDENNSAATNTGTKQENKIISRIGQTVVYKNPPVNPSLKLNLSQAEMRESFQNLADAIDRHFSFFVVKDIPWDAICREYLAKIEQTSETEKFYQHVHDFVCKLKDAHSWLQNYQPGSRLDPFAPPISIRRIENKAVIVNVHEQSEAYKMGVRPGWIIAAVNGKPTETYLELLRAQLKTSSSERNLVEKSTRMLLCGKQNSPVEVDFLSTAGESVCGATLNRTDQYSQAGPASSFKVTKSKSVLYGIHSCGMGYIRILTFDGRMEIADDFDLALEKMRNTEGLIIDIRDNPGGYGTCQARIIGRFLSQKSPGSISYQRNGPNHSDFLKNETYLYPSGKWQYNKPVALLLNSITGSASDLFAANFVSTGRVTTMGQTTHGNVTGVGIYVHLPCNLIVRISNGYIADSSGQIIEGNGNKPKIPIEPTIEDARKQIDGVLERAFVELAKQKI